MRVASVSAFKLVFTDASVENIIACQTIEGVIVVTAHQERIAAFIERCLDKNDGIVVAQVRKSVIECASCNAMAKLKDDT